MNDLGVEVVSGIAMLSSFYTPEIGVLHILGKAIRDNQGNGVKSGDIVGVIIKNTCAAPGWTQPEINRLDISGNVTAATLQMIGATLQILVQDGEVIKHYVSTDMFRTVEAKYFQP